MLHCHSSRHEEPSFTGNRDLRVYWHVMMRATCQKKCRAHFPALQLPPPGRQILEDFNRRSPYRYLHFAHSKASFLRGVKLIASSDYSSGGELMEEALRLYLQEFDLCQELCEGISQLSPDTDFFTVIADVYVDVLRCKLKCEENLMPNVGGYFVEKFVATVYHYLQYTYYKMNDGRRAVPCAYSYSLFEPEDQVMKQNLVYYKAYSEQWGLQPDHSTARTEAQKHYNQTVTQKQMLKFVEKYLLLADEDFLGPEEAALLASESPDVEFEEMGDYEESIYADWRQPKGKGDAGESDT